MIQSPRKNSDCHRNLNTSFFSHAQPLHEMSWKSVNNLLRNPADWKTERQHNLHLCLALTSVIIKPSKWVGLVMLHCTSLRHFDSLLRVYQKDQRQIKRSRHNYAMAFTRLYSTVWWKSAKNWHLFYLRCLCKKRFPTELKLFMTIWNYSPHQKTGVTAHKLGL